MSKTVKETKKTKQTSQKAVKAPQTMEELLAKPNYKLQIFKVGDIVEGVVTEKAKKTLYVDIGGKTEGLVLDREIKAVKGFVDQLEAGDKVQAIVTQAENDRGQILLSLKKAALTSMWAEFEKQLKTGEIVKVVGKEINRGGLVVDAGGVQGFIPSSQFGSKYTDKMNQLINKQIEAKVIEADREKNRLILSEREVSEAELLEAQSAALSSVKKRDVLEGEVAGVMPFGFFVKVIVSDEKESEPIELEGLVHISEISWEKVEKPEDFYKQGDKVKVQVLTIDEKSGKLGLSIKRLENDPWDKIDEKYPKDAVVEGEITRVAPFGAFVKLEPGVEALIHISKVPTDKVYKAGEKVKCFVELVDKENRKMSLGVVLSEKPVGYK